MLEVELPYPPSINHYWRRGGHKTLISREGRRFRAGVVAILAALRLQPLAGDLTVEVELHRWHPVQIHQQVPARRLLLRRTHLAEHLRWADTYGRCRASDRRLLAIGT